MARLTPEKAAEDLHLLLDQMETYGEQRQMILTAVLAITHAVIGEFREIATQVLTRTLKGSD